MPSNCGAGEDSWKSLGQQEIKPVNLKGNQPWILVGRTGAEAETPVFWSSDVNSWLVGKVPDAGKDWGKKEKRASEDEMAGRHHWCNGHELEHTSGDGEGQGGLACCSPWGHKGSDTTGLLNNNNEQDKSLFLSPETRDSQLEVGTVVPQPSGPQTLACSPLVLSLVLYGLR